MKHNSRYTQAASLFSHFTISQLCVIGADVWFRLTENLWRLTMIKLVMPMKRRPGMTIPEFRDYYETRHRLIGEKYLKGYASKYMRRFTKATVDRDGVLRDPEYDVFLEIWYADEATMAACGKVLSTPEAQQEIREDEQRVFDMRFMRSYLVDESVSDLD